MLSKGEKVKNILFNDDKERIIKSLGVDYIYNIPFTEELMKMKPVDFIESILIEKMNMKEVICGFNYRFGNRAEGDVKLLTEESVKRDFGLHIVEAYKVDDEIVSSSLIRKYISQRNMGAYRKSCTRSSWTRA